MSLEITEKEIRGVVILALGGRLVLGSESGAFRAKVNEVLDKGDWMKANMGINTRLVLDLSDLGFVDSAGLGSLIAARVSAVNRGATIKLASLTKKMRDVLAIAKIVTVFDIYENVDAAIGAFPQVDTVARPVPAEA